MPIILQTKTKLEQVKRILRDQNCAIMIPSYSKINLNNQ